MTDNVVPGTFTDNYTSRNRVTRPPMYTHGGSLFPCAVTLFGQGRRVSRALFQSLVPVPRSSFRFLVPRSGLQIYHRANASTPHEPEEELGQPLVDFRMSPVTPVRGLDLSRQHPPPQWAHARDQPAPGNSQEAMTLGNSLEELLPDTSHGEKVPETSQDEALLWASQGKGVMGKSWDEPMPGVSRAEPVPGMSGEECIWTPLRDEPASGGYLRNTQLYKG